MPRNARALVRLQGASHPGLHARERKPLPWRAVHSKPLLACRACWLRRVAQALSADLMCEGKRDYFLRPIRTLQPRCFLTSKPSTNTNKPPTRNADDCQMRPSQLQQLPRPRPCCTLRRKCLPARHLKEEEEEEEEEEKEGSIIKVPHTHSSPTPLSVMCWCALLFLHLPHPLPLRAYCCSTAQ